MGLPDKAPDDLEELVDILDRQSSILTPGDRWTAAEWVDVYEEATERGVLIGFGSVRPARLSCAVSTGDLEVTTGLTMSALVPIHRQQRVALIVLVVSWVEAVLMLAFGVASAPAQFLLLATLVVLLDQKLFGSALSLAVASAINPQHFARFVTHEAAHFLLAYLHGFPVTGYYVKGRFLRPGPAGTEFIAPEVSQQLREGKLSDAQLVRFATVREPGVSATPGCAAHLPMRRGLCRAHGVPVGWRRSAGAHGRRRGGGAHLLLRRGRPR